ncbi:MAG: hypothetical protein AAB091_04830 [Elusimicrobiota bacterium]
MALLLSLASAVFASEIMSPPWRLYDWPGRPVAGAPRVGLAARWLRTLGLGHSQEILLASEIRFLDSWGYGVIDAAGFHYWHERRHPGLSIKGSRQVLPPRHWGRYPFFYASGPARYQIVLKNFGPHPYKNLRIKALQERWYFFKGWSARPGSDFAREWKIDEILPGQVIALNGQVGVTEENVGSGFERVRLQVLQVESGRAGSFLIEQAEPFLWCPEDSMDP